MFELTGRVSIAPKLALVAFMALAAAGCAKNPADDASLGLGANGGYARAAAVAAGLAMPRRAARRISSSTSATASSSNPTRRN